MALKQYRLLGRLVHREGLYYRLCGRFSGLVFNGFVMFFCSLRLLCYRFGRNFAMLFSRLSFLWSSGFSFYFFVSFNDLSFLGNGWFNFCFPVFFGSLNFLLCSWPYHGFVMSFVMDGPGSSTVGSSRCLSGTYCISSEGGGRETHNSDNDQS